MTILIKRLAANELGATGGHQRGGILVPKGCREFFPALGTGPNPELVLSFSFQKDGPRVGVRYIYYCVGTRDEYRLTPIPHEILGEAKRGDLFVIESCGDNHYFAYVVRAADHRYVALNARLYGSAGVVVAM